MALIKDFVVKQGIIAEGTQESSTTASGTLILGGGAGIGGSIFLAGAIKRIGDVTNTEHNLGAQLSLRDATFTDSLTSGRTAWGMVNYFGRPTLDTISENATYTNASSVYIKGAPAAGTNLTIEKAWSLYITSGTVYIGETTGTTTTFATQALQIAGGLGFNNGLYGNGGGSLFGVYSINGSEILTRATQNVGLVEFPDGIRITTSTQSISTTTGALVVDNNGGAGIGGNLYLGGRFVGQNTGTFLSTENAVSTSTGALTLKGGLGVGQDLYAQNGFFVSGLSSTSSVSGNSLQIANNGGLGVGGSARFEGQVWLTSGLDSSGPGTGALVVQGGAAIEENLTANTANILDTQAAASTASAAFTVAGGVGIGRNLIVGAVGSSTGTTATNALVVAGGGHFGGDLTVEGSTVIKGDLLLLGTGTQVTVNSTNTYIVDPVIEIGGGANGTMLTVPDIYDKGLLIHYQNASSTVTDFRAFVGLENTTERFIFKQDIAPGIGGNDPFGDYYTTGTWSTLEAGSLILRNNLDVAGTSQFTDNATFASTVTFTTSSFTLTSIANNALQVPDGGIGTKYLFVQERGFIGNAEILTTGTVNSQIGGIFTLTFAFVNQTQSVSTDTGAVTVTGGVGIGGNLYVGGNEVLTGTLSVLDDTQSVSTDTGAVTVVGGVGIGLNLNVGGQTRVWDDTNSTATTNGALVVDGGVGIGQDLRVAGQAVVTQGLTADTVRVLNTSDSTTVNDGAAIIDGGLGVAKTINATRINLRTASINSGTSSTSTATGDLVVAGGVGIGGAVYVEKEVHILSTETSISTTTGALTVVGGAGIGRDVVIGGSITRTGQVTKDSIGSAGAGLILSSSTYIDTYTSGAGNGTVAIHSLGRPTLVGVLNPTWSNAATLFIDNAPQLTGGASATKEWALLVNNGNVKIGATTANPTLALSTMSGAFQVAGGVGIGGNTVVGGTVKATDFLVSENKISSSRVTGKSTNSPVTIDSYTGNEFTTAKYLVQVVDLGTPNSFHVTELLVTYDGSGSSSGVYISQYGIITNAGELGTFDVSYNGAGDINVVFTPNYVPVSMNIRVLRLALMT